MPHRSQTEETALEILPYALRYAALGWPVLPLNGKLPITERGSKDATTDVELIQRWWAKWPKANVGIATGHNFFALDVDIKSSGDETIEALEAKHGKLPDTIQQITGSGGRHFLFRLPVYKAIKNSASKIGPGLDIRGEGGYIVAEPSIHPVTKHPYAFDGLKEIEEQELLEAPDWLLELAAEKPNDRFVLPERIEEGSRNTILFKLASKWRGSGMIFDEIKAGLLSVNSSRSDETLPTGEVESIAKSVCRYEVTYISRPGNAMRVMREYDESRRGEVGNLFQSAKADPNWLQRLSYTFNERPEKLLANVIVALESAPHWYGSFAYDEFSMTAHAMKDLIGRIPAGAVIGDYEISLITAVLQNGDDIRVGSDTVAEGVATVAKSNSCHPVRNYLEGLRWDGERRIDAWLVTYLGVPPSNYAAAIGTRWLISAVARIFEPGCKADACLILEGLRQGQGKSTALRILGGEWFSDEVGEIGNKDTLLQIRGKWIIELAELDALSRHDASRIKAFISRQVDRYRPPYGRVTVDVPRQCIFAGTVNHDTYFKDETGNRRFWPVRTGKIDLEALRRDRDFIWAEAVELFRDGHNWYLDDPDLCSEAEKHQLERYELDPWQDLIGDYCTRHGGQDISVEDLLNGPINKPVAQWTQADRNRIGRCLRLLGYVRASARVPGSTNRKRSVYRHLEGESVVPDLQLD
ncbi:MAG: VapE domain-containing protein [Bryobacteraceae bacterium]